MAAGSREQALILEAIQDDGRSKAILVTTSVFLAISLVSVGLRCFVRTRVVRAFGWDDNVMLLAMVSEAGCHTKNESKLTSAVFDTGSQPGLRRVWNPGIQVRHGTQIGILRHVSPEPL